MLSTYFKLLLLCYPETPVELTFLINQTVVARDSSRFQNRTDKLSSKRNVVEYINAQMRQSIWCNDVNILRNGKMKYASCKLRKHLIYHNAGKLSLSFSRYARDKFRLVVDFGDFKLPSTCLFTHVSNSETNRERCIIDQWVVTKHLELPHVLLTRYYEKENLRSLVTLWSTWCLSSNWGMKTALRKHFRFDSSLELNRMFTILIRVQSQR